jgi:hypothetical protein
MAHEEGYVESAEEIFDREFPEGSQKRQEELARQEREKNATKVPEEVWKGNG